MKSTNLPWLTIRPRRMAQKATFNGPERLGSTRRPRAYFPAASGYRECDRLLGHRVREGACASLNRPALRGSTYREILSSQEHFLHVDSPARSRLGTPVDDGIWIQRNVFLDSQACLIPPVFIGQNCQIEHGVKLGPNVVVSDSCYIRAGCEIRNSLILRNTLVGEGLAVEGCVLDRRHLFHIEHDVAVSVDDNLLIGDARQPIPDSGWLTALFSRPLRTLTYLLRRPVWALHHVGKTRRRRSAVCRSV